MHRPILKQAWLWTCGTPRQHDCEGTACRATGSRRKSPAAEPSKHGRPVLLLVDIAPGRGEFARQERRRRFDADEDAVAPAALGELALDQCADALPLIVRD